MEMTISRPGTANALVAVLLLMAIAVCLLAPHIGTIALEVGFPVLAFWLLLREAPDRFAPSATFPAIFLLWFWLGSIPILPGNQSNSLLNDFGDRQWFLYLLGFTALWCGTLALKDRDPVSSLATLRAARIRWREDTALLAFAAAMLLLVLAWASITAVEGLPIFSPDVASIRVDLPARHHMAYQLEILLSDLLFPLVFLYLWSAPAPKLRKTLYGCSTFIVFVLLSQGNRGLILPPLLTVFALRHYLSKPWQTKHIMIAGLVILPLVSVTGYLRSIQHFGPSYALDLARMGFPVALQPFSNIYLYIRAPLDTFRNAVKLIPETTPFQHGSLSLGFVEQVLPGRHPSSDFFFKDLLGHSFEGFGEPASILGTFYADFGVAGIIGGMFLTGVLSRLLYIRMFSGSLGWLLVYCFFWQKLIGSLYGSLFTYAVELIAPLCWLAILSTLTARPSLADISANQWRGDIALNPHH